MFTFIGMGVVIVAIAAGYAMEHGNFHVLFQPAEVVIIGGAAMGSLLIASPGGVAKIVFGGFGKVFAESGINKASYVELLLLLNDIFVKIKKEGLVTVEKDVERPEQSPLFKKYPAILSDSEAIAFITDNIRVMISSNLPPYQLEELMDIDMEASGHERLLAPQSITRVADSLPGLGIVAAVLGVVLTMGKIKEPPEVLGHSIGAALVGTFLGILACYGFLGPMATNLEHKAHARQTYLSVIKTALVTYGADYVPHLAVEAGRRAIPGHDRPSFQEMEALLRKAKGKG
ncbi:MAG: flagellar motor stator protein MotA [Desulfobulbaceae bacterium]|nr:flagellar motor stator protein MotA [Desulfobulbaceae bacterium]